MAMKPVSSYAGWVVALLALSWVVVASADALKGKPGKAVFDDGFETGDTSRWSQTVPPVTAPPPTVDLSAYPFAVSISDVGGERVALLFTATKVDGADFVWTVQPSAGSTPAIKVPGKVGVVAVVGWPCSEGEWCTFTPSLVRASFKVRR